MPPHSEQSALRSHAFSTARAAFFNQERQDFTSTGSPEMTEATSTLFYAAVDPLIATLLVEAGRGVTNTRLYEDLCRFYNANLPPFSQRSPTTTMFFNTLKGMMNLHSLLDEGVQPPPLLRCGCLNCSIGNEGNCSAVIQDIGECDEKADSPPPPPPDHPVLSRHNAFCEPFKSTPHHTKMISIRFAKGPALDGSRGFTSRKNNDAQ